jgi:hypothetical protein
MILGPASYATAGGLSIAYQVIGEGDRKLVWVPGLISHLEPNWKIWVSLTVPGLAMGSLIRLEDRGAGVLKGVPGEWTLSAVIWANRYRASTGAARSS